MPRWYASTAKVSREYIDTFNALDDFLKEVCSESVLGLDTEFMHTTTYLPKLELVQISTPKKLAVLDYSQLKECGMTEFFSRTKEKTFVIHSCQHDLQTIFHHSNVRLENVFDTQLAASFLGYGNTVSLADLAENELGIALDKSSTLSNWSLRPLTQRQLDYAFSDVEHSLDLYRVLRSKLCAKGRFESCTQKTQELIDAALSDSICPENAYMDIPRHFTLTGVNKHVLKALARWREEIAILKNYPPNMIVSGSRLLQLAKSRPETIEDLVHLAQMHDSAVHAYGPMILSIIRNAAADYLKHPGLIQEEQEHQLKHKDVLQVKREGIADKRNSFLLQAAAFDQALRLDISPNVLLNRPLLFGKPFVPQPFHDQLHVAKTGAYRDPFTENFARFMDGKATMRMDPGSNGIVFDTASVKEGPTCRPDE